MPLIRCPLRNEAHSPTSSTPSSVQLRHREISARVDRLGTVLDHLAALEHLGDHRMGLELLKFGVRVDRRVLVIEAGHVADADRVALQAVDPAAAVGSRVGRKPERVYDLALGEIAFGQFPNLFDTEREDLLFFAFVEPRRAVNCFASEPREPSPSTVTLASRSTPGSKLAFACRPCRCHLSPRGCRCRRCSRHIAPQRPTRKRC